MFRIDPSFETPSHTLIRIKAWKSGGKIQINKDKGGGALPSKRSKGRRQVTSHLEIAGFGCFLNGVEICPVLLQYSM